MVEVAMALAIMGLGSVSLIGLIPLGLHTMHEAMGNTIEAQITQNLTNDILLASSADLLQYQGKTYYFDDEGSQLTVTNGVPAGTVYTATISLKTVDNSNSPAALNASTAYSMTVAITSTNNKSQPRSSSVIIANN